MTSINSVRLTSAQIFMRTFKDNSETQSDSSGLGNSMAAQLLGKYNIDTSDDGYDSGIYSLLDGLNAGDNTSNTPAQPEKISGDIGTASFMAGLKQMLEDMKATPDGKAKAEAMLKALEAGKLTVTDSANGLQIKAWDVEAETEKKTESKPTTEIPEQNWTDFLKNRLTRERNASYMLSENGAYVDKVTGENSQFRTVGDTYVYLSWPEMTADV